MTIRFVPLDTRTPKQVREALMARAAANHGVEPSLISSDARTRKVCQARWEVWASLHAMGYSTPRIGRLFNRDHSTVVHGLARHRALAQQGVAA